MIKSSALLNDLKPILRRLEDDIRERSDSVPAIRDRLQADYNAARAAQRTGVTFVEWRDDQVTQAAVAWILGCVFVRFIEDNELVQEPWLSGPGDRLARARDQHTHYFRQHPHETDREYLLHVFNDARKLPAISELFDEKHNPIWQIQPSGDGAELLVQFFQKINAAEGGLIHDFTDPKWNTRFLGDLYQDLSEAARKKYALLQTPEFVEEFILDRTLTPAIETFGLKEVRMIDCTCGSGHFLLGSFHRILNRWFQLEPSTNVRELVQRTLKAIHGVDLNPFAVAIARFRLLIAALEICGIKRLKDAPNYHFNLAVGDSLLHGRRFRSFETNIGAQRTFDTEDAFRDELKHHYEVEDSDALHRILGQQYHAVVGNPPYITVKDKLLNEAYRQRFASCHRKYSLAVPFMERFFDLAVEAESESGIPAGYVGMITANSFMKREFGKKLIEVYISHWDITHVIDTAGAYIPGHGTPTVILFGKHQKPVVPTIRAVMGIKGEPATPDDPSQGNVWQAILVQVDQAGSEGEWVSVSDTERSSFCKHPWSIGGGGVAELKSKIDQMGKTNVNNMALSIGFSTIIAEDDAFSYPSNHSCLKRIPAQYRRPYVIGEGVREWAWSSSTEVIFPYDEKVDLVDLPEIRAFLWPYRTTLWSRPDFSGKTYRECGRTFWEFHQIPSDRNMRTTTITFGNVSTHNNFVQVHEKLLYNAHAPLITLKTECTPSDSMILVALLNSSTACFWMKQVYYPKGGDHVGQDGARVRKTLWDERYEFDATKLRLFPIPGQRQDRLAVELDRLAQELQEFNPQVVVARSTSNLRDVLTEASSRYQSIRMRMIALQEELDWQVYQAYGLIDDNSDLILQDACDDSVYPIALGQRAFEILMARQMRDGELDTTWFIRHGSVQITETPSHWPEAYRQLVERRIEAIKSNHDISLIEKPEYKRRWNVESWEQQLQRALREWLLSRLEDRRYWVHPEITSGSRMADRVRQDVDFMQVAEMYRNRSDFDVLGLLTELVQNEGVPLLPVQRYRDSGLRKREVWEQTWALQRQEDSIDEEVGLGNTKLPDADRQSLQELAKRLKKDRIGSIAAPPKYGVADFKDASYWRLRGRLDVPKERFILFPGCEREADQTPVFTWAGWNYVEQAQAIAGYYEQARNEGWSDERRIPLLAGVLELVPWLKQWHNDIDPSYGIGMGDFFEDFVKTEARAMGKSMEDLRNWKP
jgi:hypothetical protein